MYGRNRFLNTTVEVADGGTFGGLVGTCEAGCTFSESMGAIEDEAGWLSLLRAGRSASRRLLAALVGVRCSHPVKPALDTEPVPHEA